MERKRFIQKLFILLSLPLVIWLYHNQITNWHYHVLDNGTVMKHAHPYKSSTVPGTPFQKHHHNSFEFLFLSLIYSAVPLLVALLVLGILFTTQTRRAHQTLLESDLQHGFYRALKLRGPPQISLQ